MSGYEVAVTRKCQMTIPARLRKKYLIEEGTRLEIIETRNGILIKPKKPTIDLAGSGTRYVTRAQMRSSWTDSGKKMSRTIYDT